MTWIGPTILTKTPRSYALNECYVMATDGGMETQGWLERKAWCQTLRKLCCVGKGKRLVKHSPRVDNGTHLNFEFPQVTKEPEQSYPATHA